MKNSKTKERHYEIRNEKGDLVEVIEETLPGRKKNFGNMVFRTSNHNLYQSGSKRLPGEKDIPKF